MMAVLHDVEGGDVIVALFFLVLMAMEWLADDERRQ